MKCMTSSPVADSNALVLLTGPTGTGKELLANTIHYRSRRRHGPFISVNCGTLQIGCRKWVFGHEQKRLYEAPSKAERASLRKHVGERFFWINLAKSRWPQGSTAPCATIRKIQRVE